MPEADAIAPISTNIGITAKAYSLAVAYGRLWKVSSV